MENGTAREQSEFNMAVSYLNRLNALFYVCDESAMSLNVYQWFHSLLAIYRELSTEINPLEKQAFNKKIMQLSPKVNNYISFQHNKGHNTIEPLLYQELHEFEISLRQILKDSGLQMKMQEDAFKALK